MRQILVLAALIVTLAVTAFTQDKSANFSGTWKLDTAKSQLSEFSRIEAMTMTVTQTAKDLKVATETKRQTPPSAGGMGRGAGMGRVMGGDGETVYSLDGKETVTEVEGPNGKIPVKHKAKTEGGKVYLTSSRTFNGPMGEVKMNVKETWSLADGGKTLTVVREQSTPRGTNTNTLVFTKQ